MICKTCDGRIYGTAIPAIGFAAPSPQAAALTPPLLPHRNMPYPAQLLRREAIHRRFASREGTSLSFSLVGSSAVLLRNASDTPKTSTAQARGVRLHGTLVSAL